MFASFQYPDFMGREQGFQDTKLASTFLAKDMSQLTAVSIAG